MKNRNTRAKDTGQGPAQKWFRTMQGTIDYAVFKDPPREYRGYAMADWDLSTIKESDVVPFVHKMRDLGYGGFFAISWHANARDLDAAFVKRSNPHMGFTDHGLEYLSDEALRLYDLAITEAKKCGLGVIFYDDYAFPTGTVAGQFYKKFPQRAAARLDRVEQDINGPGLAQVTIPSGTYLGAVLVNLNTLARRDVSRNREGAMIQCQVPAGNWKLMAFVLNHEAVLDIRNPGIMNYLEKEAVRDFLSISYDRFHAKLRKHFGTVIPLSFYDEPSLHWVDGRMWCAALDKLYQKKNKRVPLLDYPALWHDLGPETAAIRNAFHGLRAGLYANAFVAQLGRWCRAHQILLTGHMDQEEVANPVPINGDLMQVFAHQDVPGVDDIFWWGRSNPGYKIVTSASFNFDKPVTMCETYAAYRRIDRDTLYRAAMDQFAMGVNFQCPTHGGLKRNVPQCLSDFNIYLGRLSCLLRGGRHVADVAVLYPIAALQAGFTFSDGTELAGRGTGLPVDFDFECTDGWKYAYRGGRPIPEIDYLDVGELLFRHVRVDFTYVHPTVLARRCVVRGDALVLNNRVNRETYRVLVVPGGKVISLGAVERIREFYLSGGTLIATTCLPYQSAEPRGDRRVQEIMGKIFGVSLKDLIHGTIKVDTQTGFCSTRNAKGGRAYFVPQPTGTALETILRESIGVRDVAFREPHWDIKQGEKYDGALTYIHKVKDKRHVYFFANSSGRAVDTRVVLRGHMELSGWDPHTGRQAKLEYGHRMVHDQPVTDVRLVLPAVYSLFFVQD